MTGPCPGGAYCYPVFSGGYTTVPGQIIAGQPQAPIIKGVGNITGFVCNTTPQGKPGEKFWQGACPGTWGPQGPFYPTSKPPAPKHGECVPKNPPPAPPGYKLIWRKAQIAGPQGQYTTYVCKPLYVLASSPAVSDPDCKCGQSNPATGGAGSPTVGSPSIVPKNPTTGPQDGCGPNMASGGTEARKLWGHDAGEHFNGGAVTGQLISLPVHDGTNATSQPDWTHRPRVIRNAQGIYQVWDGTADGNVWLAPGELYDHHLYGDGTLAGSLWPGRVSYAGLMIHSAERATAAHGDNSCGLFGMGHPLKNNRRPARGYDVELDYSNDPNNPDINITSRNETGAQGTGSLKFNGNLLIAGDVATGVCAGGVLSVGTPDTTFSISDGHGYVVDSTTNPPTVTTVTWSGKTNVSATYIGSGILSYISIDSSGNVVQSATRPTPVQRRTQIFLGVLVHVNLANINTVNQEQQVCGNTSAQARDIMDAIGFLNTTGNVYSANGANLNIDKSVGTVLGGGANWATSQQSPNILTLAALTAAPFQYRLYNGTNHTGLSQTDILPDILDDGTSTPATVNNNKFTIQRIYSFLSNAVKIQPGQTEYNNIEDAIAAVTDDAFVVEPSILDNGIYRAALIVKKGVTDLSDTTQARFISVGKFGFPSIAGTSSDHGSLSGLADDDHTQYMKGEGSATDNAIVRWDTTSGRDVQDSGVIVDDSNNMSGVVSIDPNTIELGGQAGFTDTTLTRLSAGVMGIEGDSTTVNPDALNDNAVVRGHGGANKVQHAANVTIDDNDNLTATGHIKSDSADDGVGYATGAGGTVTQATSKTTGVTINKVCGKITTHNASLSDYSGANFTVTNSTVAATDTVVLSIGADEGVSARSYVLQVESVSSGSFNIVVWNFSGGALGEAIPINFAVIKAVTS